MVSKIQIEVAHVDIFLIIFGAHMNNLYILKVNRGIKLHVASWDIMINIGLTGSHSCRYLVRVLFFLFFPSQSEEFFAH
jgi:hypothetical protein